MTEAGDAPLFQAVIVPHRSLSRRALLALSASIALASLAIGTFFLVMGAWPVAGFGGAEVALALLFLSINARGRRASEVLILDQHTLRIIRTDARGRRRERLLDPNWLGIRLEERHGRVPALWLLRRDRREEIAAELGEEEKRALAAAVGEALRRRASPRFDNPQLRE